MATHSITGRAILIDHVSYALKHSIYKNAISHHSIPLHELKECLAEQGPQGTTITPGDILFIRSGFTRTFEAMSDDERKAMGQNPPSYTGVETSEDVARWIWEERFGAVAGDAPSFEAWRELPPFPFLSLSSPPSFASILDAHGPS